MINNSTPYANNIFEQPWWLDLVADGRWNETVSVDKNGKVIGRIAYVHDDSKVYNPALTQTTGIWMADEIKNDYGVQKNVIYELFEQINRYKNVYIHLAPEDEYVLPFRWMGYSMEPRFTYRIENLTDCEILYNRFNKTAKKNIKSAKNKVEIRSGRNADTLLKLLEKTFSAQGRKCPMPTDLVRNLIDFCDSNECGKYFEAVDSQDNVHSCAYFVYDENVFYYLLGGSDPEFRSSGAQSLVIWEGIQLASKVSRVFDFEGSMVEGIENFFRQFGGRCTPYYEIRKQGLVGDLVQNVKPRIKKFIGYKI